MVLCDVKLPDGNGVELVQKIKTAHPSVEVILLTAYGNIPDGVQAIKNGLALVTGGNAKTPQLENQVSGGFQALCAVGFARGNGQLLRTGPAVPLHAAGGAGQ